MVGEAQALRRFALLGAIVVASWAGSSGAEPYSIVGQCRAGLPNGAYELRMADGRLRIAGAFAQGKKTGTFIFWTPGGARLAVIPYDEDVKTGTVALWYVASAEDTERSRKLEAPYVDDRPHGVRRSWHANGTLSTELHYQQGVLAEARAWSDTSTPLPDDDARAIAARDVETEAQVYATLEAIVRDNLPRCE